MKLAPLIERVISVPCTHNIPAHECTPLIHVHVITRLQNDWIIFKLTQCEVGDGTKREELFRFTCCHCFQKLEMLYTFEMIAHVCDPFSTLGPPPPPKKKSLRFLVIGRLFKRGGGGIFLFFFFSQHGNTWYMYTRETYFPYAEYSGY